jgi:hypothetical protein
VRLWLRILGVFYMRFHVGGAKWVHEIGERRRIHGEVPYFSGCFRGCIMVGWGGDAR